MNKREPRNSQFYFIIYQGIRWSFISFPEEIMGQEANISRGNEGELTITLNIHQDDFKMFKGNYLGTYIQRVIC